MNYMCNGCMLSRAAFGFQSRTTDTFSIIYSHKIDAAEREENDQYPALNRVDLDCQTRFY